MAGFDSAGNQLDNSEDAPSIARNTRIGLGLFALYFILYATFVLLNTFSPSTMEMTPLAGINLDVLYGFGLIIAAVVLALLYGWLCRRPSLVTRAPKDRAVQS